MMEENRKEEASISAPGIGSRVESRLKRRGRRRFFTKKWFILVLVTTTLLVVGGCSAVMISAKSMPLDKMGQIEFASTIYDADGKPVAKLGSTNHEYVKLSEIKSRKLIEETFIAVEDRRFHEHHGVDYIGMARALITNVLEGRKAEGGGTITMQVARNIILENTVKTYTRKLKEVAVAWNLERKYSKEEILQAYLNYIYFGNDVQGIQMAAKIYFDKDITREELQPQEVALLAGLPKAPSAYNPYQNEKEAKERRNTVLMVMAEQGIISESEKEKYQKTDLGVNRKYLAKHLKKDEYQAYKHYVAIEAEKRYGLTEEELATGGFHIHTSLVPKAQRAMDQAIKDDSLFQNHKELDGGATMIDPRTGGIAAIAGGRNYLGRGYLLRSLEKKQPGSSIKPITVFAPAVQEKGYNEYTQVPDPSGFHIGSWKPKNFQDRYFGKLPLKDVVAKSLNVATAWLLQNEVGRDTAVEYATRMGLDLAEKDKASYAALALGGLTEGTDTVQMAQAYTAFANNGKMTEAHAIDRILLNRKEVMPEEEVEEDRQVLSTKTAYYMTRMLQYNVQRGTGTNAQLPDGRDVAGKTGTTQDSKEAWFVGYTREYVMAAMVYNQNDGQVELSGGAYPAKIFRRVMAEALEGTPVSRFINPGVEPPEPPFVLKSVRLEGQYDDGQRAVQLRWNDYDDRVVYRVERSENGSDWSAIAQTPEGSYTDGNIEIPQRETGDPLDEIFGGKPKTYYYRVIAIDTETEEVADPSNILQVVIQPPPPEEPPPPDGGNEEGDPQGDEQGDPPGSEIVPPPGEDDGTNGGDDGQQGGDGWDGGTPFPGDQGGWDQSPPGS